MMSREDSYEMLAKNLVDEVIKKTLYRLEESNMLQSPTVVREEDYEIKDIKWLTIEEFSPESAEEKIHEFIETWEYDDCWLYCIDFLGEEEFEFDKRYVFRARWSIPTRRKPIPRATASIYFTFNVSKIKPKTFPVEVYYVFETNRLVHKPGFSRFREKWLKDIIESKVLMTSTVTF
ncbi:A-kinase anchor protein 14-like isoform X2 [Gigantopelta aegis]|nr:A-kinase anchor protein 14-like isoform X2 [Gigantopelta aegis]